MDCRYRVALFAVVACMAMVSAPPDRAQVPALTTNDYARVLYGAIQSQWWHESYSDELEPGSSCSVRISQARGGKILDVKILPDCDFNDTWRSAAVAAAWRSGPLPYERFESVYQSQIDFVFRAASVADRKDLAESSKNLKEEAESDKQWEATVGVDRRRRDYIQECWRHLYPKMPAVALENHLSITVIVDKAGKIVDAEGGNSEHIEPSVLEALMALPPCEAVPPDVMAGAQTLAIPYL